MRFVCATATIVLLKLCLSSAFVHPPMVPALGQRVNPFTQATVSRDIDLPVHSPHQRHAKEFAPRVKIVSIPEQKSAPLDSTPAPVPKSENSSQDSSVRLSQILAFNSGFINAAFLTGILGRAQAVTPMTDSWTKFALGLAQGDVSKFVLIGGVIASFGLGSFCTGIVNPRAKAFDASQRWMPLVMAGSLLAAAASVVAHTAWNTNLAAVPTVTYFLICAASGIQNSFTSTLTQNWCRTSHMTGTTTDFFTILGQCVRGETKNAFKIPIYGGLLAMFATGGFLGATWATSMKRAALTLLGSSGLYFSLAMPLRRIGRQNRQNNSRGRSF